MASARCRSGQLLELVIFHPIKFDSYCKNLNFTYATEPSVEYENIVEGALRYMYQDLRDKQNQKANLCLSIH